MKFHTFAASALASLVATGLAAPSPPLPELVDLQPVDINETSHLLEDNYGDHHNELEARDDDTEWICYGSRLLTPTAQKNGFRTFIDRIPDTVWNLDQAPIGFTTLVGKTVGCAALFRMCSSCGTVASGPHIRKMLHKGYAKCVLDRHNDAGEGRFYNYEVRNRGYRIMAGGGACPGIFGQPGKNVGIPSPNT